MSVSDGRSREERSIPPTTPSVAPERLHHETVQKIFSLSLRNCPKNILPIITKLSKKYSPYHYETVQKIFSLSLRNCPKNILPIIRKMYKKYIFPTIIFNAYSKTLNFGNSGFIEQR